MSEVVLFAGFKSFQQDSCGLHTLVSQKKKKYLKRQVCISASLLEAILRLNAVISQPVRVRR